MGCPHFLCLQTRERARRPDRVTSETTPCLAGGIGLPRLREAREAPSPFFSFPFFSPGRVILRPPGQLCRCSSVGRAALGGRAPVRPRPAETPCTGKRRMDAGKNGAQIAGWKRAGLQARPIKTHPSVSSSRDGWPYLSQSTTVDGAHCIAFLRPNIQPRRG